MVMAERVRCVGCYTLDLIARFKGENVSARQEVFRPLDGVIVLAPWIVLTCTGMLVLWALNKYMFPEFPFSETPWAGILAPFYKCGNRGWERGTGGSQG